MSRSRSIPVRAHPWHGIPLGEEAPAVVPAYIEMLPTDVIKYELDKQLGMLKVDRPQRFSAQCPSLYGFIPQTYCGSRVAAHDNQKTGHKGLEADGDPLDICVLSERPIERSDIVLRARPIGGLRMIDTGRFDDKIIAVLVGDLSYGGWQELRDCPEGLIKRFEHYFLTYKEMPAKRHRRTSIPSHYDRAEAYRIIDYAQQDYEDWRHARRNTSDFLSLPMALLEESGAHYR